MPQKILLEIEQQEVPSMITFDTFSQTPVTALNHPPAQYSEIVKKIQDLFERNVSMREKFIEQLSTEWKERLEEVLRGEKISSTEGDLNFLYLAALAYDKSTSSEVCARIACEIIKKDGNTTSTLILNSNDPFIEVTALRSFEPAQIAYALSILNSQSASICFEERVASWMEASLAHPDMGYDAWKTFWDNVFTSIWGNRVDETIFYFFTYSTKEVTQNFLNYCSKPLANTIYTIKLKVISYTNRTLKGNSFNITIYKIPFSGYSRDYFLKTFEEQGIKNPNAFKFAINFTPKDWEFIRNIVNFGKAELHSSSPYKVTNHNLKQLKQYVLQFIINTFESVKKKDVEITVSDNEQIATFVQRATHFITTEYNWEQEISHELSALYAVFHDSKGEMQTYIPQTSDRLQKKLLSYLIEEEPSSLIYWYGNIIISKTDDKEKQFQELSSVTSILRKNGLVSPFIRRLMDEIDTLDDLIINIYCTFTSEEQKEFLLLVKNDRINAAQLLAHWFESCITKYTKLPLPLFALNLYPLLNGIDPIFYSQFQQLVENQLVNKPTTFIEIDPQLQKMFNFKHLQTNPFCKNPKVFIPKESEIHNEATMRTWAISICREIFSCNVLTLEMKKLLFRKFTRELYTNSELYSIEFYPDNLHPILFLVLSDSEIQGTWLNHIEEISKLDNYLEYETPFINDPDKVSPRIELAEKALLNIASNPLIVGKDWNYTELFFQQLGKVLYENKAFYSVLFNFVREAPKKTVLITLNQLVEICKMDKKGFFNLLATVIKGLELKKTVFISNCLIETYKSNPRFFIESQKKEAAPNLLRDCWDRSFLSHDSNRAIVAKKLSKSLGLNFIPVISANPDILRSLYAKEPDYVKEQFYLWINDGCKSSNTLQQMLDQTHKIFNTFKLAKIKPFKMLPMESTEPSFMRLREHYTSKIQSTTLIDLEFYKFYKKENFHEAIFIEFCDVASSNRKDKVQLFSTLFNNLGKLDYYSDFILWLVENSELDTSAITTFFIDSLKQILQKTHPFSIFVLLNHLLTDWQEALAHVLYKEITQINKEANEADQLANYDDIIQLLIRLNEAGFDIIYLIKRIKNIPQDILGEVGKIHKVVSSNKHVCSTQ